MGYKKDKIVEAFKVNEIERILVVDDAYDPPNLNSGIIGDLADFLGEVSGQTACKVCEIEEDVIESATEAADEGDFESPELEALYTALYTKYAETSDGRFDPGGCFSDRKGIALEVLRPLEALLKECGDSVQIKTTGKENAEDHYRDFSPHMVFLDYYLSDSVPPGNSETSDDVRHGARDASVQLLKKLVAEEIGKNTPEIPAIVLMSSQTNLDVDQFRHDASGQILALRFTFLQKQLIRRDDQDIIIENDAADALLNTSQGFLFGKQIQQALEQWRKGTETALEDFMNEIRELHLRDFAYLTRFRLREQNQRFDEYLEWFFGESLKGLIEEKVDWSHPSFSMLNFDQQTEKLIEGAFDGPSNTIATLFHRARVKNNSRRNSSEYRLGDLYAQLEEHCIRVVITPDCDLVVREGRLNAKSILTMVGTLETFDKEDSSADDFLIRDNSYYSVRWDPKNLETFPIECSDSLNGAERMEYIGTFRPIYAQEIQRRVLRDLSRVGLPAAPAFGMNVPASVWVQLKNGYIQIETATPGIATVFPQRADRKGGPHALLRRKFLNELVEALRTIDVEDVKQQHRDSFIKAISEDGVEKLHDAYLRDGRQFGDNDRILGTGIVRGTQPRSGRKAPWLQIALDISDSAMESIETMDPVLGITK